jgi:hypothetical protein
MKAGLLIVVVLIMGCDGREVGEPGGDVTESTPNDSVFDPMVQTPGSGARGRGPVSR